jgi:hypothetical protein
LLNPIISAGDPKHQQSGIKLWARLMGCVGDLVDLVDMCTQGVSGPEGMDRLMDETLKMSDGYVSGQAASNRWKFPDEKTPVMNENIISLFDQLCYVVMFGNVSSMMERVPQVERDCYFAGVRKFASKMRKTGEYRKRLMGRSAHKMK